jgi:DNA-binding beta-propeller fold protein YncE
MLNLIRRTPLKGSIWLILLLTFSLTAGLYSCSDLTGSKKDNSNSPTATSRGKLYISNAGDGSLIAFDNALSAEGNILPSRRFPEAISGPIGVFLDEANDTLYVANTAQNAILIYENASTLTPALGSAIATRVISGPKTGLAGPFGVVYDPASGRLYVVNRENSVAVFQANCAGAAALSGNIAPCQTLVGTATLLDFPKALALDTSKDILYISNSGTNSILVYPKASQSIDGNLAPTREIKPHSATTEIDSILQLPFGLAIDSAHDRLYVVNTGRTRPAIFIYENASSLSGEATPDRLLLDDIQIDDPVTGAAHVVTSTKLSQPAGIFIDADHDKLYVVNSNNTNNGPASVVMFSNISTRCAPGTHLCHLPPDQTLFGIPTGLTNPTGIAYDRSRDLIYIANTGANNIVTFSLQGDLPPIQLNAGNNTELKEPSSFFYDQEIDRLYITHEGIASPSLAPSILVYENVSSKSFLNTRPDWELVGTSNLTPGANDIDQPRGIFIDKERNLLLILSSAPSRSKVVVYALDPTIISPVPLPPQSLTPSQPPPATRSFTLPAPMASFSSTSFNNNKITMAVDKVRGDIYVADDCTTTIDCINNQPNGNSIFIYRLSDSNLGAPGFQVVSKTVPDRYIGRGCDSRDNSNPASRLCETADNTKLNRPHGLYYDATRDMLYVSNAGSTGPGANSIVVFHNASTLGAPLTSCDGPAAASIPTLCNVAPNRVLSSGATFPAAEKMNTPISLFVNEGADRLFVVNKGSDSIFIFNNASTIPSGDTHPSRIIAGPNTKLGFTPPGFPGLRFSGPIFVDTHQGKETIYVGQPKDPDDPQCVNSFLDRCRGALLVFGLDGGAGPSRVWSGGETPLPAPSALAVDVNRDILYTAVQGDPAATADDALFAFAGASEMQGGGITHRTVCSPAAAVSPCVDTKLNNPAGLFVDSEKNRLYVSNGGTDCTNPLTLCNSILVFYVASRMENDAVPDQIISAAALNSPHGLALDTNTKTLYVANTGGQSVLVFKNAESLHGTVTPDAEIIGSQSQINAPVGVAIDPVRDVLYVLNQGTPDILVFDQASTRNGNVAPSRIISGSGFMVKPSALFLDPANNILYVSDQGNNAIYSYSGASSAQGTAEHKNLIGNNTGLNQPSAIFVDTTR